MKTFRISLAGNPNSGKSSMFNLLTGLNQKVANFSGVTVDRKEGQFILPFSQNICRIIDLPGMYSFYFKKEDEQIAHEFLIQNHKNLDLLIITLDATNIKRNLLLCSQLLDLKIPAIVIITMNDIADKKKISIDINVLARALNVPIITVNPRRDKNLNELKKIIEQRLLSPLKDAVAPTDFVDISLGVHVTTDAIKKVYPYLPTYIALHYAVYPAHSPLPTQIEKINYDTGFNKTKTQVEDIQKRYSRITDITQQCVSTNINFKQEHQTHFLDKFLLHKYWGYGIMLLVMFLLFQSVFWLAQYPMDAIEYLFNQLSQLVTTFLPNNLLSSFITNGLISGLGGVVIFVPQIMILSGIIALLEDSGYMARISLLSDRFMSILGLNGKSVIPLISGLACAVPAIIGARNIENKKEKLITIFILPFITCSARLPVFSLLITMVVPKIYFLKIFNLQGLVLMFLYFMGFLIAFLIAFLIKFFIKNKERSLFVLELPFYKTPIWRNIFYIMYEKTKIFVFNAGKIIIMISIVLWILSSFGPNHEKINQEFAIKIQQAPTQIQQLRSQQRTILLEQSYAGSLGRFIEPVIRPLGFDWKIGISLITSFAAREVFVGTMATLYSFEDVDDTNLHKLQEKLLQDTHSDGTKIFNTATIFSLIFFYLIALQCMSTVAIVKRETRSWFFAITQVVVYTSLAYLLSFVVYRILI